MVNFNMFYIMGRQKKFEVYSQFRKQQFIKARQVLVSTNDSGRIRIAEYI